MIFKRQAIPLVMDSLDEGQVTIAGYASVFGTVDSHNDIILKGAFKSSINKKEIKLLWQHDIAQPIGIVNKMVEDDYGLMIQAKINTLVAKGKEAVALIRHKMIDGLSIGFTVENESYNNQGVREINLVNLWEVSVVTFPSNQHAKINHCKNSENTKTIFKDITIRDGNSTEYKFHLLFSLLNNAHRSIKNIA